MSLVAPEPDSNRAPASTAASGNGGPVSPSDSLGSNVASGDAQAFDRLHQLLGPALEAFFSKRMDSTSSRARHSVDDLCQRTWVEVWRIVSRGGYDPARSKISTYVFGVAVNVWKRHCRERSIRDRRLKEVARVIPEREIEPASVESDALLDACTLLESLRDCVDVARSNGGLDGSDAAILSGVIAGQTERQLARELDLASSTIHDRKKSVLKRLRQCLEGKGHSSNVAGRETR